MSNLDIEYMDKAGINYRWSDSNTLNFKCPICNSSKKTAYMLAINSDNPVFHCFRRLCHETLPNRSMFQFLKAVAPELAPKYLRDRANNPFILKRNETKIIETEQVVKDIRFETVEKYLKNLNSVRSNNPARELMVKRGISENHWNKLFYFYGSPWDLYEKIVGEPFDDKSHGRADWQGIIVPLISRNDNVVGFTMRTMNKWMRYLTLKHSHNQKFFFGEDDYDPNRKLFIFEGIFDRLTFADASNKFSMMSTDIKLEYLKEIHNCKNIVFCFDNEYDNSAIVKNAIEVADAGFEVFIWDSQFPKDTDMNDLRCKFGMDDEQILSYIDKNTFKGYGAKTRIRKKRETQNYVFSRS